MIKMTQVPLFHRWWGQSVIGLVVAILIPIGIFLVGWTQNPGRSIAIGVCSWVILMLFQIVHLLRSLHAERLVVPVKQTVTYRASFGHVELFQEYRKPLRSK